ncbi:MAG TPA: hypothetical protein VFA33_29000 [Bryobacteraceae bacterium]|nr:hypothetical protein [Bryobacteraceae bacterium]
MRAGRVLRLMAALCLAAGCYAAPVRLTATREVLTTGVTRVGVNLGLWTSWGAEQLAANILKNPGFEGVIDRAVVIVKSALGKEFADDAGWLGRADGFWKGARGSIRTGRAAGQEITILRSREHGSLGLPDFISAGAAPGAGEVVSLTRIQDGELPTQWWFPNAGAGRVGMERGEVRPGSPGARSLRVSAAAESTTEVLSYVDAIGERAGKLLPLTGAWRLSFWCRRAAGSAALEVEFRRLGSPAVFSREVIPGDGWAQETFDFEARDAGPPGTVQLRFQVRGTPEGTVLLDDVDLRRVEDQEQPFRREVVETLRRLRPGYLRDWQGQLGDTLENRLAGAFARRASRYRPGGAEQTDFFYSLPDFLDLCQEVGADPWIVAPTTFSDAEWVRLGRFLASEARYRRFSEILVEFGNENWNGVFRAAGIPAAPAHGEAADRAFRKLREGAPGLASLRTVINAQHANPYQVKECARYAPEAGVVAVAPYFLDSLECGLSGPARLEGLFAGDGGKLAEETAANTALGKETAVYEVNLHTTRGTAPEAERDPLAAGAAAGSALAATVLDALALGVRRQCVYALAGYDTRLADTGGFVKLWGIARDLGPTCRLRPTGLAVQLLNRVLAGEMCKVEGSGLAGVRGYAFRSAAGWAAALVSSAPEPREVALRFPADGARLPQQLLRLAADGPFDTNEEAERVRITAEPAREQAGVFRVRIPAWGMAVLGGAW